MEQEDGVEEGYGIEDQVPMIWTSEGNLPIELLDYSTEWYDAENNITMAEVYRYKGEVVRRSVHVYDKKGLSLGSRQAEFA